MEAHQEDHDHDHLNMVIKRRRTKRPRPPSPLALGITTSSCSTMEGANSDGDGGDSSSGELVDGQVANSSSRSNKCGGIDQIVKNTNQEEENMVNCLILIAQGHNYQKSSQSPLLDVYQCKTCNRSFPSFQALGGHRASHKKPKTLEDIKISKSIDHQQVENHLKLNDDNHVTTLSLQIPNNKNKNKDKNRVHECSICGAEFTSGQALGGHMRRHRPLPNSIAIASHSHEESHHEQIKNTRTLLSLDLNLPAPEDDHRPENKFTFASKEQVIVFSASPLVKNVFPTEDERLLLDLEGLAFESIPKPSQSQHMSDGFFCTWAPKTYMGQSSHGDVESSNVDMNELESFRAHVDSKFAEILQAIVDLNKKVDAKRSLPDAFVDSGGLHTYCDDLDVDGNQGVRGGDENVKNVKSNDDVGDGDSSKEVVDADVVVTEQAREDVLPQGGDVDGGLAKGSEYVLAPPPEDVSRPQAGQLADEAFVKAEDTVKDCGVDPSGASDVYDCGVFVACFAEYLIENIEIHIVNFDIDGLRSRYGVLLWHYGRQKQENGKCSDSEDPGR
ncbi:hypothetical protein K7X08_014283 [Anisodus acutangulus]|uniref:C2H2-type domain-containing protein n=1 Tax=Anisodus acutangulus TaxID=402998 RepID=A0A9Q1R290_9SOLA|nr:hypothetical protein K7X08_014283 [Anisodus acutangulus]